MLTTACDKDRQTAVYAELRKLYRKFEDGTKGAYIIVQVLHSFGSMTSRLPLTPFQDRGRLTDSQKLEKVQIWQYRIRTYVLRAAKHICSSNANLPGDQLLQS